MSQLGKHAIEHLKLRLVPVEFEWSYAQPKLYGLPRSKIESFVDGFPRWLVCFKHLKYLEVQIPTDKSIHFVDELRWIDPSPTEAERGRIEAQWPKIRRFDALVGGDRQT